MISRRKFLKCTALASAASTAGLSSTRTAGGETYKTKQTTLQGIRGNSSNVIRGRAGRFSRRARTAREIVGWEHMADVVTSGGSLLEAHGIGKRFGGVAAADGGDFHIKQHEHVALVGDNGAGKLTLVKILTGAILPDSGEIWFDGQRRHFTTPLDARRVGIETVYQNLALADQELRRCCLSNPSETGI